jgi:basic membrane protein A
MGNYFGRIHQTDYLCGLIAGGTTRNGRVGYVAPKPIPEVMRGINSFALGVREANPEAKVFIRWVHDWYNPEQERACAEELISQEKVDFLGQGQDCPNVLLCAQEAGIPGTGYNADMSRYAPDSHLCSPIWDWSKVYIHVVRSVKDGTWRSESIWWGIDKGLVEISPMSEKVSPEVRELVGKRRVELIQGKREVFDGPIRDQSGRTAVPAGRTMTDEELLRMDFLVEGVVGEIAEPEGPQHE